MSALGVQSGPVWVGPREAQPAKMQDFEVLVIVYHDEQSGRDFVYGINPAQTRDLRSYLKNILNPPPKPKTAGERYLASKLATTGLSVQFEKTTAGIFLARRDAEVDLGDERFIFSLSFKSDHLDGVHCVPFTRQCGEQFLSVFDAVLRPLEN